LIAAYQRRDADAKKIMQNVAPSECGGRWYDTIRVYPQLARMPSSSRIPKIVDDSLMEADKALQANAPNAACVMLGRAVEAVCRDILLTHEDREAKRRIMLGEGIKKLREKNVIDARLYEWAEQVQASRNLAAHAAEDGISMSMEDAQDLQTFVHAMLEYIY